jgi:transcriptional regulator with GAF, ATPase, and Fis domain
MAKDHHTLERPVTLGAVKKLKPEELSELGLDREQKLSNSFEDPGLNEILQFPGNNGSEESAVSLGEELILDASVDPLRLVTDEQRLEENSKLLELGLQENLQSVDSAFAAKSKMGEKMFSLVAADLKFDHLIEEILITLMDAAGAQAGAVLEMDVKAKEFFFRANRGGGDVEKVKSFRVPAYQGIVGHVAETKESILIQDTSQEEKQIVAVSMTTGFETKSCVAVPVIIGGQLYGVIEFFNKISGEPFDQNDVKILEDGALMAAKVLEVRFLLAELSKRMVR